jgi:hypothetical protein
MFPGQDITAESGELIREFRRRRNPAGLPPLDVLRSAARVDKDILRGSPFMQQGTFLVLFEHPVLEDRTRLVSVPRDELLAFVDAKMRPQRGEGRDMTIAPPDFSVFVICNHDGQMFLLVPPGGQICPPNPPPPPARESPE